MEGNTLKLQLLEKKDLTETEIDIRYSSMTQPLNRIVQYIRHQEYLIQGIFEKKLYQIPLNEVLYFETVDKKTFMYTHHKIFECKKTLSAIEQDFSDGMAYRTYLSWITKNKDSVSSIRYDCQPLNLTLTTDYWQNLTMKKI